MAEAQGFEPWGRFHARRFSRPVHSTTLPNLRAVSLKGYKLIRKACFVVVEIRRPKRHNSSLRPHLTLLICISLRGRGRNAPPLNDCRI